MWNSSSLPVTPGNLSDGNATFWQFLFTDDTGPGTVSFAIGTYDAGTVGVVAPLSQTNSCIEALGLGPGFASPGYSEPDLDSTVAGEIAYRALIANAPQFGPYAVLWTNGYPILANSGWASFLALAGSVWDVDFYACGQAGVTPPYSAVTSWHVQGSALVNSSREEATGIQFNCTLSSYDLTLALNGTSSRPSGVATDLAITATGRTNSTPVPEVQGLAAWMFTPHVNESDGASESPAADACLQWVPDVTDCGTPTSSWYAVLESPSGAWLDSYGIVNGSAGWVEAGSPIVTGETLVLISSGSLDGTTLGLGADVLLPSITTSAVAL